jgi:hypothetical protein
MNPMRGRLNFAGRAIVGKADFPEQIKVINSPMVQNPMNTSRLTSPHCSTRSALDRNFMARASSRKPEDYFYGA